MKQNVALLCVSVMLIMTFACSSEDKDIDALITSDEDQAMIDDTSEEAENEVNVSTLNIKIGDKILRATLVDNSSVEGLIEALSEGPITINMRDYGNMEKVGRLGRDLPRNDEQITVEAGILFCIREVPWLFTTLPILGISLDLEK